MRNQKDKEQVLAEKMKGWALVRGKPENLPKFGDFKAVEHIYSQAQDFQSAFAEYWKERLAQVDLSKFQESRRLLLYLFEWRIIGTLDSICATTMIGRPSSSAVLLRALYETYLNSLLIASDTGPFDKSILRSKIEDIHPSPDRLAERFLSYNLPATKTQLNYLEYSSDYFNTQVKAQHLEAELHQLAQRSQEVEKEFGFTSGRDGWSPINSLRNLHNHLWPKGSDAKISRLAFTEGYDTWYGLYYFCYLEPCYFIHGVAPSFFSNELQKSKKRVALDSRIWNEDYLSMSLKIASLGVRAIADSLGTLDLWDHIFSQN